MLPDPASFNTPAAAPGELRRCEHCQTEFTVQAGGTHRRFCSPACRKRAHAKTPPPTPTRTCPVCSGPFTADPMNRQKYCSPTCRRDAEKQRDADRDEQRARRLGEPATPTRLPTSATRSSDGLAPAAIRDCPHCHQPITIVALLATPEAARPTIAMPAGDLIPLRRT